MKRYSFKLNEAIWKGLLKPIRSKRDTTTLLMKSIKLMLVNPSIGSDNVHGEMILIVSKMSRLFYLTKDKIFSIGFPFSANFETTPPVFSSKSGMSIDSRITSEILGILSDDQLFNSGCPYQFIDPVLVFSEGVDGYWQLLLDLLMYEDAYIRYDYDEKNQNHEQHPVNHYDVFYSPYATFKLGLRERVSGDRLVDLLSIETNCHFIEKVKRRYGFF